jgi:Aldehyde dehydrogenase family
MAAPSDAAPPFLCAAPQCRRAPHTAPRTHCAARARLSPAVHSPARTWQVNKIKIGDPMAEGVKLGPLVSQDQQRKVLGFIERAQAEGAKVRARCDFEAWFLRCPASRLNLKLACASAAEVTFLVEVALACATHDMHMLWHAHGFIVARSKATALPLCHVPKHATHYS